MTYIPHNQKENLFFEGPGAPFHPGLRMSSRFHVLFHVDTSLPLSYSEYTISPRFFISFLSGC